MNTLTKNPKIASKKARDVAAIRGKPVWCHFASTLTFYIDHIPEWWTAEELARRRKLGEIVDPPGN
jgi:hypothetical protein